MDPYPGRYVSFFDLDKTILSVDSGSVFIRETVKRGLMSFSELLKIKYLSFLFRFSHRNTLPVVIRMGGVIKGVPVTGLTELTEYVINNYLIEAIRPEIISEIAVHRQNGASIAILSSAISQICRPIGAHIGADDVICTVLESKDGLFTGTAENGFCVGDEKRERLIKYCHENNYDLRGVYYYTDRITDLSSLEIVGHPVCVHPDKKLARLASRRGWRII